MTTLYAACVPLGRTHLSVARLHDSGLDNGSARWRLLPVLVEVAFDVIEDAGEDEYHQDVDDGSTQQRFIDAELLGTDVIRPLHHVGNSDEGAE